MHGFIFISQMMKMRPREQSNMTMLTQLGVALGLESTPNFKD
jgi:hypothetical protein